MDRALEIIKEVDPVILSEEIVVAHREFLPDVQAQSPGDLLEALRITLELVSDSTLSTYGLSKGEITQAHFCSLTT